jgi:predicted ATP-binding protein involved in virulence
MDPFISKLHIQNFKCFQDLVIELKPGINILYGLNGAGKTTILEALSIAAASLFMEWGSIYNVDKRNIEPKEVRLYTPAGMRLPEFQFPVRIAATGSILGSQISWIRELNSFEGGITAASANQMREKSREAISIAQNGNPAILPVIAFFSTNRLFVGRRETTNFPTGRFRGYFNAVNDSHTQKQIRAWFKDQEDRELQERRINPSYLDPTLKGLRQLILGLFDQRFEDVYYFESAEEGTRLPKGLYFRTSNADGGHLIPEEQLSDGYRNFLWLFVEIAWRCISLNPILGEHAAAQTNGIVLIDEVDLHLHPAWQQKILKKLSEVFPCIQFVLTSHSPIILGAAQNAHVLHMEGQVVTPQSDLYGLKPSYVLEVNMNVKERLPELQGPIDSYLELLNSGQGRSEEALALRAELHAKLSPYDPFFQEADLLIEFLTD